MGEALDGAEPCSLVWSGGVGPRSCIRHHGDPDPIVVRESNRGPEYASRESAGQVRRLGVAPS